MMSDITDLIIDFENVAGEIKAYGNNTKDGVFTLLNQLSKDGKVVYTDDMIAELLQGGGGDTKEFIE